MTPQDDVAFVEIFMNLRRVFNMRAAGADELREIADGYLKAMRRFSIAQVRAAAEKIIETSEHFPKPAQWIRAIPSPQNVGVLPMMEPDATEHKRAIQLGYEDDPCGCHECKAAEVSHRMLRYVPETDSDDRDLRMVLDGKAVVKGHWAHGEELKRWYAARDAFFALRDKHAGKLPRRMPKPLHLVAAGGESPSDD